MTPFRPEMFLSSLIFTVKVLLVTTILGLTDTEGVSAILGAIGIARDNKIAPRNTVTLPEFRNYIRYSLHISLTVGRANESRGRKL